MNFGNETLYDFTTAVPPTRRIVSGGKSAPFVSGESRVIVELLNAAVGGGNGNVIDFLIDNCGKVEYDYVTQSARNNIFHILVKASSISGKAKSFLYQLLNGKDLSNALNAANENGLTPLYLAVFHGQHDIAQLMVKAGGKKRGASSVFEVVTDVPERAPRNVSNRAPVESTHPPDTEDNKSTTQRTSELVDFLRNFSSDHQQGGGSLSQKVVSGKRAVSKKRDS